MELNKIINADCMDIMKDIPDNYFELACVDPPYGINVKTRVFSDGKNWDKSIPNNKYFTDLFRISKNQIIWGGNYFIEYLKNTSCFIIWDKKITDKHRQSMCEFAWTSLNYKSMCFYSPPPGERGFYNIDQKRIHPTQKPIKLYRWLLQNYAKPNDKIIDTHSGSGSSAIACHLEGFDFLAIEKDYDYWKASVERYNTEISQQKLF